MEKLNLAILASGSGSTAEAIIKSGVVNVVLVISNNSKVGVVEKAQRLKVPVVHLPRGPYKVFKDGVEDEEASKLKYGQALIEKFEQFSVTHISQNGWMIKTPINVIKKFEGRIFNQHPGPLDPGYIDFGGDGMYGERVHDTVLRFSRAIDRPFKTEATIHRVEEKYDEGPLMMTEMMNILDGDTPQSLAERLLPIEHQLQIKFWKKMQEGGVGEFSRETRLILPQEVEILKRIKQEVIAQHSKEL